MHKSTYKGWQQDFKAKVSLRSHLVTAVPLLLPRKMYTLLKVMTFWVTLIFAFVHAMDQRGWNPKERGAWLVAKDYIETGYQGHSSRFRQPLVDYIPFESGDAKEAWKYAENAHAGPIHTVHHRGSAKSIYVLTRIPNGARLAQKWRLDADGVSKDAFLFWKVKSGQAPKLLGGEAWAAGAPFYQQNTVSDIWRELAQKVGRV